jgi:putative ABC transport system permease protein
MPSFMPLQFAWRQLRADPAQSALVVVGLALGLALALIAALFMRSVTEADADRPAADRLITFEWRVRTPGGGQSVWYEDVPAGRLQAELAETGAPIEASAKLLVSNVTLRLDDGPGGAPRSVKVVAGLTDPAAVALLGLTALRGDVAAALASPEGLALTVSKAEQLFGTRDVLGRVVTAYMPVFDPAGGKRNESRLVVMAVLADPRLQGAVSGYDALTGFNSSAARELLAQEGSVWTFSAGKLFARLRPGATADELGARAQALLERQPAPEGLPADFLTGGGPWASLRAMPLLERPWHGAGSETRRMQLGGVVSAALAVLLLAVINFVNLWSVRTVGRQREIGLRKALGADVGALVRLFFVESLVVVGAAALLGLLLAWWAVPAFQVLMQQPLEVSLLSPGLLLGVAGGVVLIAAASALPLSSIAWRVQPQASLAGRQHSEGGAARWLRRVLTVVQFGAAALLSALAIVMLWQHRHAAQLPRGLEVQDRLAFDVPFGTTAARAAALVAQIKTWPEVVHASMSSDVPGRAFHSAVADYVGPGGERVTLGGVQQVGPGYFALYGVPVLAGRLSADHVPEQAQDAVVLERRAAARLGFASPQAAIGQTLARPGGKDKPVVIVAVVDDLRLESARAPVMPHVFIPRAEIGYGAIGLHSRDVPATRARLATALREAFPDEAPQLLTLAEQQARHVADEQRIGRLIGAVGLIALALAAVGLYALAAYTLRRREREIVLRKLHGAGPGAVAWLIAAEFAGVLGAACAVALPLAAWLSERYLSGFTERAAMGPFSLWALLAAVALLALVTALAVARHLRAALALPPLQALRG